jgi:hypothetical protein
VQHVAGCRGDSGGVFEDGGHLDYSSLAEE